MKLSATLTFWAALAFAAIAGGYGLHALWSLEAIADATLRDDWRGFAWFWLFLGAIGLLIALLARLRARGRLGEFDS
jgi:hypothetical protein